MNYYQSKNHKQRYKIKKSLHKAVAKCRIKTPRWALGSLFNCTGDMEMDNVGCLNTVAHFLYSISILQKTNEKNLWRTYAYSYISPSPIRASRPLASTSRKYVSKPGKSIPDLSEKLRIFWLHSSVFALEKQRQNLNFQSFFTSKTLFGGYFQWNVCTYFQETCSWTRYNNVKFIR